MPHRVIFANRLGCLSYLLVFAALTILFIVLCLSDYLSWPENILHAIFGAIPFVFLWWYGIDGLQSLWAKRLELSEEQIIYCDGETHSTVAIADLLKVSVTRGAGFDSGPWTTLNLESRDDKTTPHWNMTPFTLCVTLQIAGQLARLADLQGVIVEQDKSDEKSLRRAARGMGTLTLLTLEEEKTVWENRPQTFLFKPRR